MLTVVPTVFNRPYVQLRFELGLVCQQPILWERIVKQHWTSVSLETPKTKSLPSSFLDKISSCESNLWNHRSRSLRLRLSPSCSFCFTMSEPPTTPVQIFVRKASETETMGSPWWTIMVNHYSSDYFHICQYLSLINDWSDCCVLSYPPTPANARGSAPGKKSSPTTFYYCYTGKRIEAAMTSWQQGVAQRKMVWTILLVVFP